MTDDLFRKEAIRHRTRALYGDVVLAAPLSTWVITGLLIAITLGLIGIGVFGNIDVDGVSVPLWQWALGKAG